MVHVSLVRQRCSLDGMQRWLHSHAPSCNQSPDWRGQGVCEAQQLQSCLSSFPSLIDRTNESKQMKPKHFTCPFWSCQYPPQMAARRIILMGMLLGLTNQRSTLGLSQPHRDISAGAEPVVIPPLVWHHSEAMPSSLIKWLVAPKVWKGGKHCHRGLLFF